MRCASGPLGRGPAPAGGAIVDGQDRLGDRRTSRGRAARPVRGAARGRCRAGRRHDGRPAQSPIGGNSRSQRIDSSARPADPPRRHVTFRSPIRLTVGRRRSDMFRRALIYKLLIAAALIGGLGLASPTAAQVSDQPPAVSLRDERRRRARDRRTPRGRRPSAGSKIARSASAPTRTRPLFFIAGTQRASSRCAGISVILRSASISVSYFCSRTSGPSTRADVPSCADARPGSETPFRRCDHRVRICERGYERLLRDRVDDDFLSWVSLADTS